MGTINYENWKWLNESQIINAGEGGLRYYSDMKLELRTVENLRSGE